MKDETRKKVYRFFKKHESLIFYSTGVLVGFAAGLTIKVNLKLTSELKNNIETMESFGIPVKAAETYFVRGKDDPNKFFKVIKF